MVELTEKNYECVSSEEEEEERIREITRVSQGGHSRTRQGLTFKEKPCEMEGNRPDSSYASAKLPSQTFKREIEGE